MDGGLRRRGRPRAYDPDTALERARAVFWTSGFAGSSLDALATATAMNRPSLYGAFGDKEALYLRTLERYRDEGLAAMRAALDPARPLRDGLAAVYAAALDLYLDETAGARGCFLIGTATTEALQHPAVRTVLGDSLRMFDGAFADRLRLAVEAGELPATSDPTTLALLASAVLHSLAVRARAGDPRDVLETIARTGVDAVCGPAHPPSRA